MERTKTLLGGLFLISGVHAYLCFYFYREVYQMQAQLDQIQECFHFDGNRVVLDRPVTFLMPLETLSGVTHQEVPHVEVYDDWANEDQCTSWECTIQKLLAP